MKHGLIIGVLLAIVAMPMAFAGVGFCRSMPCCPPTLSAHGASVHQPDCCNTKNCVQAPAAAGEYTRAKQLDRPTVAITHLAVAIFPTAVTIPRPLSTGASSPPIAPSPLQQRMALLSVRLI